MARRKKRARVQALAAEQPPPRSPEVSQLRWLWVVLSLSCVFALQVWMCWGTLDLPFLDTRLHYNYDNADFTFRARSGNRNGDLRSQFGVTLNTYSRWGERAGPPAYYTDHPFLVKALFQQYTKVVGATESAPRTFYLAVSFLIAAGVYTFLLHTTGSLGIALAGAATLASLPIFAVYQTTVKFEADGMLASVWLFVAMAAYLRRGSKRALAWYGALAGTAFLVHWTAALLVSVFAGWLLVAYWRRRDVLVRRALIVTVSAAVLGSGLLFALMAYLQGGWRGALRELARSFRKRAVPIPIEDWWARQWIYAHQNFGWALLGLVLALSVLLAGRRLRPRLSRPKETAPSGSWVGPLPLFFLTTLIVAALWLVIFREGSFVHIYWQYWFCFPIVALIAVFLVSLEGRRPFFTAGLVGCFLLVIYLLSLSRASLKSVVAAQLGTPDDIAFLTSIREDRFTRLLFVPVVDSPLNQWFQGPLFEYYTDRPVMIAAHPRDVKPGVKALVLRFQQRDEVRSSLETWSRRRLSNEKCGERMCAYDVLEN